MYGDFFHQNSDWPSHIKKKSFDLNWVSKEPTQISFLGILDDAFSVLHDHEYDYGRNAVHSESDSNRHLLPKR